MHDAAVEGADAFEEGHLGGGEVAGGADHMIEFLGVHPVLHPVMDGDVEFLFLFVPFHHAYRRIEAHPFAHLGLFDAALDVVPQHGAGRIGGNRLAEMLLKRIVGKFQAFLGSVGPEIAVHGAMDGLAIFIQPGAPGVVPEAAPVTLLFKADDFRNFRFSSGRRTERPSELQGLMVPHQLLQHASWSSPVVRSIRKNARACRRPVVIF